MKKIKHFFRVCIVILYSFFHQKKFIHDDKKLFYSLKKEPLSNKLIIVFPAVSKKPIYNYVLTLRHLKYNILFLKDTFGIDGSYFLGQNLSFDLYKLVDSLIERICLDTKISEIYCLGSSKGGSSALFYALNSKFEINKMIIGSPQYSLGDYFYFHGGKKILKNICGDDNYNSATKLNDFCHNLLLESKKEMSIFLYSSLREDEFHLKDTNLLKEHLKQTKNKLIFIDGNFDGHSGLANSFKSFIKKDLINILESK